MVFVSSEVLQSLVDSQRVATTQLDNVEDEVASLYGKMWPWVFKTLEMVETRLQVSHKDDMSEF